MSDNKRTSDGGIGVNAGGVGGGGMGAGATANQASDLSRQREQEALEQRISELAEQSRMLEAYMNDLVSRQITVSRLLEEARAASSTIQGIDPEREVESLMPVGIGVYIRAAVPPMKKVLVNLGANVAVEKARDDALNYVESRIKEFEVALRQLGAQRQEIANRMEQIQAQINQMLKSAQSR